MKKPRQIGSRILSLARLELWKHLSILENPIYYDLIRRKLDSGNKLLTKQDVNGKDGLRNFNLPVPSRKTLDPVGYILYLKDYLYRFEQLELHFRIPPTI
ncbi:hypothetical protein HK099_007896 [Clydaea vesicula]|uniref:Uncharacterized protein n=1 Tax=Clydaea vesicula TaxID=447962 RepID=A0AAD5Y2L4_9FUNG|nr:hypothetical protein HK099_007896 [Clydaea vesicula]